MDLKTHADSTGLSKAESLEFYVGAQEPPSQMLSFDLSFYETELVCTKHSNCSLFINAANAMAPDVAVRDSLRVS